MSQTVTLTGEKLSLTKVFTAIERQTGYYVTGSKQLLDASHAVTFSVKDMPLKDFLALVLEGQPLSYEISSTTIFIKEKPAAAIPLVTLKGPFTAIVRDLQGKPLVGATIKIKGSKTGTVTDVNGRFTIDVTEGDVLLISFIGYGEVSVRIGKNGAASGTDLQQSEDGYIVKLSPSETSLNEISINAGYYKITERNRTGNLARVTSKDIEKQMVSNPLMALQGRVAGLEITPNSGAAGSAPTIRIRGNNSIRWDGNYPLYIIDGIPVDSRPIRTANSSLMSYGSDPLSTLNPADIASIEVLKDADATAIYGSRGANGVILVTTKTAERTQGTTFNFNGQTGFGERVGKVELLNRRQYLDMRYEAMRNDNITTPNPYQGDLTGRWDTTRFTDWQDELLGYKPKVTNLQGSLSWGNANTSFIVGGGLYSEETIYPGDFGYKKANSHINLNHLSTNRRLKMNLSLSYATENNKLFDDLNYVNYATQLSPVAPNLYNPDGSLNWLTTDQGYSGWDNPMALLMQTSELKSSGLQAAANLSYEILPGLELKVNGGYGDVRVNDVTKKPIASMRPEYRPFDKAYATFNNNKRGSWSIEPQVDWNYARGEHQLAVTVGGSFQENTSNFQSIQASGYSSDALLNTMIGATTVRINSDDITLYRYNAIFGRINYNFKNRYIVNLTGRRDGSSRFGPGRQFGNFGAVGAAWIFSDEPAIRHSLPFLSFGKLRGSYGITGNDQIGDYMFYDTYSIPYGLYQGNTALTPTALYNPNFAWEENRKLEAAIQLGFFKERINIEASWYRNRSSNQLVQYQLPGTTGFDYLPAYNFPALVQNKGWEFILRGDILRSTNLTWRGSINVTLQRNKLLSFPGIEESPYSQTYQVGQPLSIQRLFIYNGIDQQTGLYTVKDLNGDGLISWDKDRIFALPQEKKYYGGFTNDITYRNFDISFLFQFANQLGRKYSRGAPGFGSSNYPVSVLRRWQKPGDITDIQRYTMSYDGLTASSNVSGSDFAFTNSTFFRLKIINLAWRLPEKMLSRIMLKDARIFVQSQNPFTFSKNKDNADPETGDALPPMRNYTFGLSFKI